MEQDRMDECRPTWCQGPGILDLAVVSRVVTQPSPSVEKLGVHLLRTRFARSNPLSIDLSQEGLRFLKLSSDFELLGREVCWKAWSWRSGPTIGRLCDQDRGPQAARLPAWSSPVVQAAALVVPICSPELSFSTWFHVKAGKSATWRAAVLSTLGDLQRGPWPPASNCGPPG